MSLGNVWAPTENARYGIVCPPADLRQIGKRKRLLSKRTLQLTDKVHDYLLSVSLREPAIAAELRRETASHPMANMQIAPEQGQFMAWLVHTMQARRIVEIGVFTGYSSLCMALAMPPGGQLVACDTNAEYTAVARRYWERAGVAERIELRLAPALQTLGELLQEGEAEGFDFVFIDADKTEYGDYYERALKLLRPGGIVAVDNVLWDGQLADPSVDTEDARALRAFNRLLHKDDRVTISTIPIADGLTLATKRHPHDTPG